MDPGLDRAALHGSGPAHRWWASRTWNAPLPPQAGNTQAGELLCPGIGAVPRREVIGYHPPPQLTILEHRQQDHFDLHSVPRAPSCIAIKWQQLSG
jgi:hypothetical protein